MNNFGLYSKYYDLFYQDKDYAAEVSYVSDLLQKYSNTFPCSILELGSGTGIHAELMVRMGFSVHGVELSENMLKAAKQRELISNGNLQFFQGDARTYRAGKRFEAVISLFHVLSYQVDSEDLASMLATAAEHLDVGGLFVFDFWYGPAVLWQRPSVRVKRLENEKVSIVRIAEPALHVSESIVDVNYTVFVEDRTDGHIEKLQETHRMRYFFLNELSVLLGQAGFAVLTAEEWLTGASPSQESWGVTIVSKKLSKCNGS